MGYFKKQVLGESKKVGSDFKKETIQDVQKYKFLANPERFLTKDNAEVFGIRSSVSEQDGKTITASYFPFYGQDGNVTGFVKRDWTKPKEEDGHFTVIGSVKVSCKMNGQQLIKPNGKTLYIVEGLEEVYALRQCIAESLKGSQYEGKLVPNVIGLPLGTANAQESVAHNLALIKSYKEIVLCLNNDSATAKELLKGIKKGKEATEDIAALLLTDNLFTIDLPPEINDYRQALALGRGKEIGKMLAFERKPYSPEKIIAGENLSLDELIAPLPVGLKIDRFPKLMEKLQGFRHDPTGEVTLYTAFSGVGKSTLCREAAWEIIRQTDLHVGFIFLEETVKKTQQSLLALELGVPLNKFRQEPLKYATREAIAEARAKVLANGRTYFLNHFGSLQIDRLIGQVKYLHHICGCKHIFLDHISLVVSGLETNNERKDLDILMTELASFASATDCHIHVVSHLKRVDDYKKKQFSKTGEEIESEPYWREINLGYLRGSGGLEQLSFSVVAVENEVKPDGSRGRVRLKVLKNREWSSLGVCDILMQGEDGRLHDASTPEDNPITEF